MFKKNVNWHYNEQFFCSPADIKEMYLSVGPKLLTIYAINKITNFFYLKFSCLRQRHVGVNWIKNEVISNRLTLSTSCPKQSNRKFEFPSKSDRLVCWLTAWFYKPCTPKQKLIWKYCLIRYVHNHFWMKTFVVYFSMKAEWSVGNGF